MVRKVVTFEYTSAEWRQTNLNREVKILSGYLSVNRYKKSQGMHTCSLQNFLHVIVQCKGEKKHCVVEMN